MQIAPRWQHLGGGFSALESLGIQIRTCHHDADAVVRVAGKVLLVVGKLNSGSGMRKSPNCPVYKHSHGYQALMRCFIYVQQSGAWGLFNRLAIDK